MTKVELHQLCGLFYTAGTDVATCHALYDSFIGEYPCPYTADVLGKRLMGMGYTFTQALEIVRYAYPHV